MSTMQVEIVSAEGKIFSGVAEMLIAPARMGDVGVTPRHAPLLTNLRPGEVRLLERTGPYKNYVWTVPVGLDEELRSELLDAFLALDRDVAAHAEVLTGLGAAGFLPASHRDFDELRDAEALLPFPLAEDAG